jgi:hypothetical protein
MAEENFNGYGPTPGDKSKRSFFLTLGAVVIFLVLLGSIPRVSPDESAPANTNAPAPKLSTRETVEISRCSLIQSDITMIESAFSDGDATPKQMSLLLSAASAGWLSASAQSTGAESDWLAKMSELSLKLESFILTGSPANGGQLLDQLNNNMDLVSQFCE